jgi:hypothetical protein
MSLLARLTLATACSLVLAGCGDEQKPPLEPDAAASSQKPVETPAAKVSSSSTEPAEKPVEPESNVEIVTLEEGPKAPGQSESAGDHRSQRIVVTGARTRKEFEAAVQTTFEVLAEDLEKTEAASKSKRVEVIAYDNPIDAEALDVYTLHAFSAVGPEKPIWENAQLDWRWRLPNFRPSDQWLRIHADYRKLRATVEVLSDAQKKVCAQHKLTTEEFIDLHAYMMMWHSGLEPEGQLLEEWKADLRKKSERN